MTVRAFAAIGDTVYVETDTGGTARVEPDGRSSHMAATPEQWLKFNGGYAVDPTPEQAQRAEAVVNGDPP